MYHRDILEQIAGNPDGIQRCKLEKLVKCGQRQCGNVFRELEERRLINYRRENNHLSYIVPTPELIYIVEHKTLGDFEMRLMNLDEALKKDMIRTDKVAYALLDRIIGGNHNAGR